MLKSANNTRIAKNTVFLGIRMVIVLLISLYTTRVILDSLGVIDYGINNVVAGFVTMCAFISTSMANASQRFFNYEYGKNGEVGAKKVFNQSFIIQLILLLFVVILIELIGLWYIENKMVIPFERRGAAEWTFHMAVLSLSFSIMQVPFYSAVMAHEKMTFYALVSILDSCLRLLLAIVLGYVTYDKLIVYSSFLAFLSCLSFVVFLIYSKKKFPEIKFDFKVDNELFRSMLSFSGWNIIGTFARSMRNQGVSMILNLFFGPIVNAAQAIANQVNSAFMQLVSNLSVSVRPQIVYSYAQNNKIRTINLMMASSKLSLLILYIASCPILIELDFVLKIWLGKNVPNYTFSFVFYIVLTSFITNLHTLVSAVVHATGKIKNYQIVCSLVNVLIVPIGYVGFCLGAEASFIFLIGLFIEIIVQIFSIVILKKLITFSYIIYFNKVILPFLKVVALSIIFPLIIHNVMGQGVFRFIIVLCVSTFVICFVTYGLALEPVEKKMIKEYTNSLLKKNRL